MKYNNNNEELMTNPPVPLSRTLLNMLRVSFCILAMLVSVHVNGQIPFTSSSLSYQNNFNAYMGNNDGSIGTGWTVTCPNFRARGNGSSNSGGAWAYGSGSDYAAGYLGSSTSASLTYVVSFVNNTGSTITGLDIAFDGEQWRVGGGNTQGFTVTGTGSLSTANLSGLNTSSCNCGSTGTATVTAKSLSLTSLSIAAGATFGIQWRATDGAGNDNGIAIDNFSITATTAAPVCNVSNPGTISSSAGNNFCGSGSTTLSLNGTMPSTGIKYQWMSSPDSTVWTNEGTGATLAVTPGNSIFYKCIVKCSTGNSADSTPGYKITITPDPVATISGGMVVCNGSPATITFSGTSGATVAYTADGQNRSLELDVAGSAGITHNFTSDTTYNIVSVTLGSCSQSISDQEAVVQVTPLPVATISGDTNVCTGTSATIILVGTPGATVAYTAGTQNRSITLDGTGGFSFSNNYTSDTIYTIVSVTSGSCVRNVSNQEATIVALPLPVTTINISGATTICEQDSVVLTAHQAAGYVYEWKDGFTERQGDHIFTVKETGGYKVVVTDAHNCMDSSVVIPVTVHSIPEITIAQTDTAFCNGGVVALYVITPDTGVNFRWRNGHMDIAFAEANFLEITTTGVYSAIISRTHLPNCADTSLPVSITVHPVATPQITWDGGSFHTDIHFVDYQWYNSNGMIAGATDSVYTPPVNGGYYVSVTDSNGCSSLSRVYNVTDVGLSIGGGIHYTPVEVYPNPVSGVLHIKSEDEVNVILTGVDGKVYVTQKQVRQLDVSQLSDGVYILRISDRNGVFIRNEKILKQ